MFSDIFAERKYIFLGTFYRYVPTYLQAVRYINYQCILIMLTENVIWLQ